VDVLEELVPKALIVDTFSGVETGGAAQDAPVVVVWGIMRKVSLVQYASVADTSYDFGIWRHNASVSVSNVYRDGRLVDSGEYTVITPSAGFGAVRFTVDQRENGTLLPIQADLISTEFPNPGAAIEFLLQDATYGLGLSVNAASFTQAKTDYTTLGITIADGMRTRRKAGEVLKDLLLHGAVLNKNTFGEYTIDVDMTALHTDQPLEVGVGDGSVENLLERTVTETTPGLTDQVKTLVLKGLFDPSLKSGDPEQYLITGTRTDAGVEGREVELTNRFLNAASVPRQLHYLWFRYRSAKAVITASMAGLEGKDFDVNDLVTVQIPAFHRTNEKRNLRAIGWRGSASSAEFALELEEYDADLFQYVAGDNPIVTSPDASTLTDYRFTIPTGPSDFLEDTPHTTEIGTDGSTDALVHVMADAPTDDNITHLVFKAFRNASAVVFDEVEVVASNGDTQVKAELVLKTGVTYDLECVTRNKENQPGFTDSTAVTLGNVTAPVDLIAPATVAGLATTSLPLSVKLNWTANTEADLFEYKIYRFTSDVVGSAVEIGEVGGEINSLTAPGMKLLIGIG